MTIGTASPTTTTLFPNLFEALKAEQEKRLEDFIERLNEHTSPDTITSSCEYSLTPVKKRKAWELQDLKEFLIARNRKYRNEEIQRQLNHLLEVEAAGELESISISIEWKKSQMWGSNPTAEAEVIASGRWSRFSSGSIGGCGYDKESTAIAEAVNQSHAFLKQMYLVKEQRPTERNEAVFSYGSGYGILPRLEGGVGSNCYRDVFKAIGFLFKNVSSGKSYDVFAVTKL